MLNFIKNTKIISSYINLMRLDKPIGIFLLLYPTIWALLITNHQTNLVDFLCFMLGVVITRSAGCVINDIYDRDIDKHVSRTKSRPIACDDISIKSAILLFLYLNLIGLTIAILYLRVETMPIVFLAVFLYSTYPLTKRFLPIPQAYLGLCFSLSIFMVFLQIDGSIGIIGIYLFIINIFWVVGYDTIYAMVDLEDDLKIGIKTSAITFGKYVNLYICSCYFLFIFGLTLVGLIYIYGVYYYICLFLSFIYLLRQIIILFQKKYHLYFKMFLSNMWVGLFISLGFLLRYA